MKHTMIFNCTKEQLLTDWFPADIKPVHVGWYITDLGIGTNQESGFMWYWNGKQWMDAYDESKINRCKPCEQQNRKWRGSSYKIPSLGLDTYYTFKE